jgi:hypothetical protein
VDRRSLVLGGAALAAMTNQLRAQMPMRVKVTHPPQVVRQACAERCWAASASMIFGSLGHPIDQKKIIESTYGASACAPAQQEGAITRALGVSWQDDGGQQFRPAIKAGYDQQNDILAIDHAFIVNELREERPLLYANRHHCMVMVEAYVFPASTGPNIVSVGVLDPLADRPEFHLIQSPEWLPSTQGGEMTYLAAVRI